MAAGHPRLERPTITALAAMAMAVFVIANDVTALSVALPSIESDFDADVGTAQWVISAYALIFGVLIVTGGRLADLVGRRRIFFVGAAIFAAFSLLGGLAVDAWMLIACRALMGIGGALMWPSTLGMTYSILPKERAALGGALIIGAAGFGNAAGRERLGPRPVLITGAACLVAGPLLVSSLETGDSWAELIPGLLLLGAGIGLFYSAITTAAVTALDPSRASLAGGIVYMFQVAGGSIGLGIATTIFTAEAGDGLSSSVERVVRKAFESGFQAAFLFAAALAAAGLLVTVLLVGRSPQAAVSE